MLTKVNLVTGADAGKACAAVAASETSLANLIQRNPAFAARHQPQAAVARTGPRCLQGGQQRARFQAGNLAFKAATIAGLNCLNSSAL